VRILITGTSPMQCGRTNRYQYGSVLDLYARALREAGHEVVHRVWIPGDDLAPYDVALVGLVPWNSIAARHVYTVCDVIYRARENDVGLVFAVDDWGFPKIHGAARSLVKDVRKRLFTTIKGRTDREWAEGPGLQMIEACVAALATRPWPTTLVPAFPWGAHDKLGSIPAKELVFIDPTAVQVDDYLPHVEDVHSRRREWMLGTLSDQRAWYGALDLTWPVTYVGSKPSRAETVIKEPELIRQLSGMWGSLCPPQPHAGGGWWRCRYVYSALTGAVLLADEAEVEALGGPYLLSPPDVEGSTDRELERLGQDQAERLFEASWTREHLTQVLHQTLDGARVGPPKTVPLANPARTTVEQPVRREAARREPREFDQTYLRASKHGTRVHRDYAAHYFRWGWATRLIKPEDTVLDVGCGPDLALPTVLSMGGRYVPATYHGVDLNKLAGGPGWAQLHGETNYLQWEPPHAWTKVVCFEVIEHMGREAGVALLQKMCSELETGGELLLSTPVFNGKAAVNHVHEWEIDELGEELGIAGFEVKERYGTFGSYRDIARVAIESHRAVLEELRGFYSEEVTANFLAPLYPNESRNNVWRAVKK
jgi:2-polyprenyl-3-methyl-5-hydroxy-6-metoxy-1,4-benzoquinol methylase